jgi:hypothetical protein
MGGLFEFFVVYIKTYNLVASVPIKLHFFEFYLGFYLYKLPSTKQKVALQHHALWAE